MWASELQTLVLQSRSLEVLNFQAQPRVHTGFRVYYDYGIRSAKITCLKAKKESSASGLLEARNERRVRNNDHGQRICSRRRSRWARKLLWGAVAAVL